MQLYVSFLSFVTAKACQSDSSLEDGLHACMSLRQGLCSQHLTGLTVVRYFYMLPGIFPSKLWICLQAKMISKLMHHSIQSIHQE